MKLTHSGPALDQNAKQQLRGWYLARLRKRALAESAAQNMTPITLLEADRKAVESFILQDSEISAHPAVAQLLADVKRIVIALCLCTVFIAAAALSFFSRSLPDQVPIVLLGMAIGAGVFAFAAIPAVRRATYQLDAAVRDWELKCRLIADFASDVLFCLDETGTVLAVTPSCAALLGLAELQLIGQSIPAFLPEADKQSFIQLLSNVRDSVAECQCQTQFKDGRGNTLDINWTCEWSSSKKQYYLLARDITAQKQVERAKSEFLAMVTHDLRSPIAALTGTLSMLGHGAYGKLQGEGELRVRAAMASTHRVLDIINDLLDADRLEENKYPMLREPFELRQAIKNAVESIQALAENKGLTVKVECPPLDVIGDQRCIERVVVNLLANAIKFSPEAASIEVVVTTCGAGVEVAVIDHGRGIPAEMQPQLFERYKQVALTDTLSGSGLGLSICKLIAEAHGGSIRVDSNGQGSRFTVKLPSATATGSPINTRGD